MVTKNAVFMRSVAFRKRLDKSLNVRSLEPVSLEDKEDKKKTNFVEKNNDPIIIDTNLENEISMEVNNRSLIKIGHFLLTKEYCARDWIDTLEVVETKVILNKIVNAIVKHINNSGYDDYIIAGVDLVGTLLASRIAFTLQAPLTYIVPEKEKNVNAHQEIDLEIEKDKKVILITDAIVTFNTVKSAIEKNKLENSVICIYTMFYRESDYQGCAEYVDKTFSINNAFRIELFRKEKCTYNKTKCIASNRRLREGEDSTDESDRTQF